MIIVNKLLLINCKSSAFLHLYTISTFHNEMTKKHGIYVNNYLCCKAIQKQETSMWRGEGESRLKQIWWLDLLVVNQFLDYI